MIVQLAFVGLLMALSTDSAPNSKADNFKMIILHNNDMHARFEQTGVLSNKCTKKDADNNKCYGGFARVAHEVRRFRKEAADGKIPPVLYLNAGDTYTGTPWFTLYKDKIAAEFLKILKPDATVRLDLIGRSFSSSTCVSFTVAG
jgi:2',3'-cyclic-nucleotide 2'-phosphodiesterase (5'-nucleotidase family)